MPSERIQVSGDTVDFTDARDSVESNGHRTASFFPPPSPGDVDRFESRPFFGDDRLFLDTTPELLRIYRRAVVSKISPWSLLSAGLILANAQDCWTHLINGVDGRLATAKPASLFVVAVGDSESGKSIAWDVASDYFRFESGQLDPRNENRALKTPEGMFGMFIDNLDEERAIDMGFDSAGQYQTRFSAVAYVDEFQQFRIVGNRRGNPLPEVLSSSWTGSWSENPTISTRYPSPKKNTHLSIFFASQPAPAFDMLDDELQQGFANRLLFVTANSLGSGRDEDYVADEHMTITIRNCEKCQICVPRGEGSDLDGIRTRFSAFPESPEIQLEIDAERDSGLAGIQGTRRKHGFQQQRRLAKGFALINGSTIIRDEVEWEQAALFLDHSDEMVEWLEGQRAKWEQQRNAKEAGRRRNIYDARRNKARADATIRQFLDWLAESRIWVNRGEINQHLGSKGKSRIESTGVDAVETVIEAIMTVGRGMRQNSVRTRRAIQVPSGRGRMARRSDKA